MERRLIRGDKILPPPTTRAMQFDGGSRVLQPLDNTFLSSEPIINPETPLDGDDKLTMYEYQKAAGNPKLISSITSLDSSSKQSWNTLEMELMNIIGAGGELTEKIRNILEKDKDKDILKYVGSILITAQYLLSSKVHANKYNFADKHGFIDSYSPMEKFGALCSNCEEVRTKIGKLSIEDIFAIKKVEKDNKCRYSVELGNISLPDYYKTVVEASLAIKKREELKKHTKIAITNNPTLEKYPAKAEQIIGGCCAQIAALSILDPKTFNSTSIPPFGEYQRHIVNVAKDVLEQTHKMKNKLANLLISADSNSPDFLELKKILNHYLDEKNEEERIIALQKIGIDTPDAQINIYREIQRLLNTPLDEETSVFYLKIANCIEEIVEKRPEPIVLTINDAASFLNRDALTETEDIPQLEEIRKSIRQFYNKRTKSVYRINPQEISRDSFLKIPKGIFAAFLKNNSHDILAITFIYGDYKRDRDSTLNVSICLSKDGDNAFDWQFIENPNDPKMGKVRNAIFYLFPAILNNVQKQINDGYQKLQSPITNNGGTKIFKGEYVPREKFQKPMLPKPLAPIKKELLNKGTSLPEKHKVKRYIIFSKDKEDIFPKDMTPAERKKYIEKIKRFPDGLGNIEMLEATKDSKEPVYRIRFDKEHRVLVVASKPEEINGRPNGTQYYTLTRIIRRNDDYKDLKR